MTEKRIKFHGAGFYDSAVYKPGATQSPSRVLMRYEINLFAKNSGVAVLNGQEYIITKNSVMVRKPGDVIRWSKLHFSCNSVHFTTTDPTLLALLDALPSYYQLEDATEAANHLLRIAELSIIKDKYVHIAQEGRISEFLWHLHKACGSAATSFTDNPCQSAIKLIQQNYRSTLSVEQLAKACGLSPSYFHKLFLQSTGTTPSRYLTLTRLNVAKSLLRRGNHSVEQVAELCGFSSQSYLCDCMKKHIGMSPRKYQHMCSENYEEI